jgi:putative ABC transport system ATP-binding protein
MVSQPSRPIVQARKLGKQVSSPEGELVILDDVTFDVSEGEAVAVVGASGSGKSTLLGLLAGLDSPTRGSVTLDGVLLNSLDEDGRAALRAQRVGFVFQSFQLLPSLTALENTMLPLELAESDNPREVALGVLDRVGLRERVHHYPNQLSGGEQQRVAIARAFASNPAILFADEPTGNLDQKTGERIIDLLFSMNRERGTTLMMVTHDVSLARNCDKTLELEAGKLKRS